MNILISAIANDDYSEEWVLRLLNQLNVEECALVFVDEEKMNMSQLANEYAAFKITYEKCRYAHYEELEKMYTIPPIDRDILKKMEPFEDSFFWMRERDSRDFLSRWRDYCEHIRVWSYLLDHLHIDVFISLGIPHEMYDYVIYALCKIKNKKFVCSFYSHFAAYSYMMNDIYNQLPKFEEHYKLLQEEFNNIPIDDIKLNFEINELFESYYHTDKLTPWCMMYFKNNEYGVDIFWGKIKGFFKKEDWFKKIINVHYMKNIFEYIGGLESIRWIKILFRRAKFILWAIVHFFSFSIKTYKSMNEMSYRLDAYREYEILHSYYQRHSHPADYSKKYIYIPLQAQPEDSSFPLGGRYCDQILMVRLLSYYLPEGYSLYVKEHPVQLYKERHEYTFRTLDFYQTLLEIPNVQLISREEDTHKLIENSCAVASIMGTAGFEALFFNKLFFMFGYYLTQYAPNVITVRNKDDCFIAMEKMVNYNENPKEIKKNMKIYFKALEGFLFRGRAVREAMLKWALPDSYWAISKNNTCNAFLENLVQLMGDNILKKV